MIRDFDPRIGASIRGIMSGTQFSMQFLVGEACAGKLLLESGQHVGEAASPSREWRVPELQKQVMEGDLYD